MTVEYHFGDTSCLETETELTNFWASSRTSIHHGVNPIQMIEHRLASDDFLSDSLTVLMTGGGDERIRLDPGSGLNRYMTAPRPDSLIAYSSSTANFVSRPAMAEVRRRLLHIAPQFNLSGQDYAVALASIRDRLRATWRLPTSIDIVFAASGTDLEYVGLAAGHRSGSKGIDNLLLGADEVGSGCIHSASGHHFAHSTPLGVKVAPGQPIDPDSKSPIRLIDIAIRSNKGEPIASEDILLSIAAAIEAAIGAGRHPLVHVVHGSKTGLILPSLAHIDALRRRFADKVSFVVDACQARISRDMVIAYLARCCTVFLTGSKYMGGPPFSGFALIPRAMAERSAGLLPGFDKMFAQAEWPEGWIGREALPDASNLGLLLRLEASLYELELYHRLEPAEIRRTLDLFELAVGKLSARIGARRLAPMGLAEADTICAQPLEMRTLVTLDLSEIDSSYDYDFARRLYEALAQTEQVQTIKDIFSIRLGQPARCVRLLDGRYGANLRIGLSMPQMVLFATMDTPTLKQRLDDDMNQIGYRIERFLSSGS